MTKRPFLRPHFGESNTNLPRISKGPAALVRTWKNAASAAFLALTLASLACSAWLDAVASTNTRSIWMLLAVTALTIITALGTLWSVINARYGAYACMLFISIFFLIAPAAQISSHSEPIFLDSDILTKAYLLILVFSVVLIFSYLISPWHKRTQPLVAVETVAPSHLISSGRFGTALALTGIGCFVFFLVFGDLLFSSRLAFDGYLSVVLPLPVYLILTVFIRPFLFIVAVLLLKISAQQREWGKMAGSLLVFAAATAVNNPLIVPRYYFGTLAVGALMVFTVRARTYVVPLFLSASAFLAPYFNYFRGGSIEDTSRYIQQRYLAQDFDAFAVLAYGLRHVEENGHSYGENIIGALLFFIPRAFWEDKPVGTAGMIFGTLQKYRPDLWSDNLSSPLVLEGYYAFGLTGVAVIGLFLGVLVRLLDSKSDFSDCKDLGFVASSFSLVMVIFVLRGSLIAGTAYWCGIVAACAVAVRVVRWTLVRSSGSVKQHRPRYGQVEA